MMRRCAGTVAKSPKSVFHFHLSDICLSISPVLTILFAEGCFDIDSLTDTVGQCRQTEKPTSGLSCDANQLLRTTERLQDRHD
jgi:hypothetical protein